MSIKYHDNINGTQYGADHKLTNNWNPDGEYKDNEYCKVYFRIECPAYMQGKYPCNFDDDKDRVSFRKEVRAIMENLGWCFSNDYDCKPTKEKSHLYIHPQDISGEMLKKEVKQLAEAFEKNQTFYLRWVDIYDTVFDITDEEYTEYLDTQKDKIKSLLLSYCKTTRKNLFKNCLDVTNSIAGEVRLHRINDKDGYYGERAFTTNYINTVVDELIKQGYLVLAGRTDVKLIRTINKTEQKRVKRFIDV